MESKDNQTPYCLIKDLVMGVSSELTSGHLDSSVQYLVQDSPPSLYRTQRDQTSSHLLPRTP